MDKYIDIIGYEGIYKINNVGTIRKYTKIHKNNGGTYTRPEFEITVSNDSSGYLKATLTNNLGEKKAPKVHKLVALMFIGERPKDMTINHKDGNKHNNSVSNLEYISQGDNVRHSYDTGLNKNYTDKHVNAKLTTEKVLEMRNDTKNTNAYYARKFNVDSGTISRARRGESWTRI